MNSAMATNLPFARNYASELLNLKRGKGVYLWDAGGNRYLDLGAGIAVNSLGYGRRDLAQIASKQMRKVIHVSNLYTTEPSMELATMLLGLLSGRVGEYGAVQFGNSGSEANEAALKYARLYADLDNTKKRLQRHYAYQAEQEKVQLLRDLLPVKDNLERALRHAPGGAAEQSLRLGVELTLKLFDDTLAQYGVTPIEAWDHPFDPDLHEAVGLVEQPNLPPGTVAHVEQMGYTIDGSVLRPAKVLVTPG